MSASSEEEKLLHSTAFQNVKSILQARQRAEAELVNAKEALEVHAKDLALSVSTLRGTLESTTDAILVTGAGGDLVVHNEKLAKIWGLSRERLDDLDTKGLWQWIAGRVVDAPAFRARLAEIESSSTESFDQLRLADGRVIDRYSTVQRMGDAIVGRVWSFRDVTDRELHESALSSSHAQFAEIIHHSPVGILIVDSGLRLRDINPKAIPLLGGFASPVGASLADLLGSLWPEPIAAKIMARFEDTLVSGSPQVSRGFSAPRKDSGTVEHYDWELHRLVLPDGQYGVACYLIDISDHVAAQEALRDSEQRVRATFEQAAVGMVVIGLDGRFQQVNRRFAQILGYSGEELAASSFHGITHADDRALAPEFVGRLLAGEISDYSLELRYVRKDGTVVWSHTTVALLRNSAGRPDRFVGVVEDISERKRSEERERESTRRLQLALSAGHLGDWSWDAATGMVNLGARASAVFGLASGTSIAWDELRALVHPDDRERDRLALAAALESQRDYDVEYRVRRPSGEPIWIASKGRGVYDPAGRAIGMIGVVQDVTERKQLELVQQRLAAVVESSDDAILSKDLSGIVHTWNRGAERIFGYTAAEMVGQSILRLIPRELQDEEAGILERQRRGERIEHYETVRVTKDGRRIDVSLTVSPIRDATGKIVGASKVARDITERKRAEAELRRNEAELRALADSIPQLAWIAGADGHIFWFNQGWYDYTGTTFEQMEGWGWQAVHDEQVLPRVLALWRDCLSTGNPFEMEFPIRGADGQFRWFLTRVRPIRDAGGQVVRWFGTNTDVDEVKRAREALWDESRLLNLLNETGKNVAADLELQSMMQTVTDATTQLSGAQFGAFFFNTTDAQGNAFLLFTLSGAAREDFAGLGEPRATPLFAPTFNGESLIRLDDVLKDERYGKWGGMPKGHLPVRSYLAVPVISRNGEVFGGLFFGHATPGVFTERVARIVTGIAAQAAVAVDNARLYERVKAAAEDRQQLLDAERSARAEAERVSFMKDEFLATLSHELRTPLNAIVGWSQVLRMRGHADQEVLEGLSVIDRNAKVQAQLIEDLLDMSRIISGKVRLDVQSVDVADTVRAALASVRHSADTKGIRIIVVLDPQAGPVWGDPGRLQQCFWNLMSNAIKFTPKNGRVQVTLARVNSHVEISVVDDGQGIAPDFLPHVFERFRQADASTTRYHGGLGLGLSIVKSIVELHGGAVHAHSDGLGKGSTFRIELPVMVLGEASPEQPRKHPKSMPLTPSHVDHPSLKGIVVLVVDDEPDARGLVKRVLEDCGARVLIADSARAALEVLQTHRPDILLSDIGMPNEDGYSLIRKVRTLDPDKGGRTPAAALSAFARPEDRTRALRAGYQMHLAKPVEPTELTAVVASLAARH